MTSPMNPRLLARVDQTVEEARAAIPSIDLVRQAPVALLLSEIVQFVNKAGPSDSLDARVRVFAVMNLAQSIRENPPCSEPSGSEWSP